MVLIVAMLLDAMFPEFNPVELYAGVVMVDIAIVIGVVSIVDIIVNSK